jgi:hypothetical protein
MSSSNSNYVVIGSEEVVVRGFTSYDHTSEADSRYRGIMLRERTHCLTGDHIRYEVVYYVIS